MDEPFVGLDPKAAHILKEMMREECDNGGAIFFSTHVLEVAEKLCDKVAIMYAGEIVEQGSVFEVFRNPVHPYARALLSALPRYRKTERRIETIGGTVPRIMEKKPKCRFQNRCPKASEICANERPQPRTVQGTHIVCCHHEG